MAAKRIEITVSEGMWGRLEVARGHEPRASFVKRALESALGGWATTAEPSASSGAIEGRAGSLPASSPAPSRASSSGVRSESAGAAAPVARVVAPAGSIPARPPKLPAGVQTAAELMAERQRRANEARNKKK